jgi:hypothetical protein
LECFLGEERRKTRSSASSHLSGEWRAADGPHAFEAQVELAKWLDKDPVRLRSCEAAIPRALEPWTIRCCRALRDTPHHRGSVTLSTESRRCLSRRSHMTHPSHHIQNIQPVQHIQLVQLVRVRRPGWRRPPEVLTVGDPREHNFFRSSSFVFRPPPFVLWPPHWFYISPEHRGYHPNAARRNKLVRASLVR